MTNEQIKALAQNMQAYAVSTRRHIHAHPELSGKEFETTKFIMSELESFKAFKIEKPLETGCIAYYQGKSNSCIALRADIDALPITEETNLPFKSTKSGIMHACGHDAHTAILLSVAKVVSQIKPDTSVLLIFQPDEEDRGGAKRLIDAGLFEKYNIEEVYGLHIRPELKSGSIAVKFGESYAASDMFHIYIHGKSCHGAEPQNGCNAISAASEILSNILKIAPDGFEHSTNSVLSICQINGGSAINIIPQMVEISGIIRSFGQNKRSIMKSLLNNAVNSARSHGCKNQIEFIESYPGVVNHEIQTQKVLNAAKELDLPVEVLQKPTYTTEDFGYYLLQKPGSFFHLGVQSDAPLHSSKLNIDEDAFKNAIALYIKLLQ